MTDPGSLHVMSQIHSSMRSSFANRSIITVMHRIKYLVMKEHTHVHSNRKGHTRDLIFVQWKHMADLKKRKYEVL